MNFKKLFGFKKRISNRDKNDSISHIRKVTINTILIGIFLTIIIESYYFFTIIDMTFFDIIISVSLVCIVFLLGIAYVLEELEKTEKELNEAEYLQLLIIKQLENKVRTKTGEVKKLLKQKNEFINQLGHDLRTPLMPLCNLIPLLIEQEKNTDRIQMLKILNRNVNHIKNLAINTIDLAKINSSNTNINLGKVNLFELTNNSIELNRLLFESNSFNIKNKISKDIYVKSDKLRLEELLTNIFSNSVKYTTDRGEIVLDAKKEDNFVIVSIKDNGIGLTSDQIDHIFDEFYKADESRHDIDSIGLGMTICKRIVELHGGRIWIESHGINKGSIVYFTLPLITTTDEISMIDNIHNEIDNIL